MKAIIVYASILVPETKQAANDAAKDIHERTGASVFNPAEIPGGHFEVRNQIDDYVETEMRPGLDVIYALPPSYQSVASGRTLRRAKAEGFEVIHLQ